MKVEIYFDHNISSEMIEEMQCFDLEGYVCVGVFEGKLALMVSPDWDVHSPSDIAETITYAIQQIMPDADFEIAVLSD